jgi:type I restriction enzyme M protein
MSQHNSQDDINTILWQAFDIFRGTIEPVYYKDYILVLLFVKYISDVWRDKYDQYHKQFDGDEKQIKQHLSFERFVLPKGSDYYSLYEQRNAANIGELINKALAKIEEANHEKLEKVLSIVDFENASHFSKTAQDNEGLKKLLEVFSHPKLDMRPSRVGDLDIVGIATENLLGRLANDVGKRGEEFYTPPEVSTLLAKLVNPQAGDRIYDPTCGSGSLLIQCANQVGNNNYAVYGQEINHNTWATCLLNMFLHNMNINQNNIGLGDTLNHPRFSEDGSLKQFDIVVSNPPVSLPNWGTGIAENDPYQRFKWGVPPRNNGDYAWISHIVSSLNDNGIAAVLVSLGVLFRGGAEGQIREQLIKDNLIDAVIRLPDNLRYSTSIPSVVIIIKKNRQPKDILFIDASNYYKNLRTRNILEEGDIDHILTVYRERRKVDNFSTKSTLGQIADYNFNLNVQRYVAAAVFLEERLISDCKSKYDVFISYSRRDMDMMLKVSDTLTDSNLRVWNDRDLQIGTPSWQRAIQDAIENSCCVVALLSPDAKESEWVANEIEYARVHNKKLFSIIVAGNQQTSVPFSLINHQFTDITTNTKHGLAALVEAISTEIGMHPITSIFVYDLHEKRKDWKPFKLTNLVKILTTKSYNKGSYSPGDYPFYTSRQDAPTAVDHYDFEGDYVVLRNRFINSSHNNEDIVQWASGKFVVDGRYLLSAREGVSIEFIYYLLLVTDFAPFIQGTTQTRINKGDLETLELVMPCDANGNFDYVTQESIAEIIRTEINQAHTTINSLQKRLRIVEARPMNIIYQRLTDD